ncbi:MAG: DUF4838 domain-containing protein [Lentisphaerae bacterium]|nr:DUF4838 domain-containing protein [Lentisphaerota bacterium]
MKMVKRVSYFLLFLLSCALPLVHGSENILLGNAKGNYTQVLVADDAPESTVKIADELATCFKLATGHSLQVNREKDKSPAWPVKLYMGNTRQAQAFKDRLSGKNQDAFTILVNTPQEIIIDANSEKALYFAIFKFLELCNMHFIMPGADGIVTPADKVMQIAPVQLTSVPKFESRLLSWGALPQRPVWQEFAYKHGMRENVRFHHNLHNVFPPSKFAATHPEFFALAGGSRAKPVSDEDSGSWQLCFSAPGSAHAAAERIKQFFADNPGENSYSLGINDSYDQCECANCQVLNEGKKNRLGVASVSESYYLWCNQVAELVCAVYPEKKLGLLAYDGTIDPPEKIKLHPALVPYITYDRYMWLDKERKSSALAHQQAWQQQGVELGYYDYIYGEAYIVPRLYTHHLQQTLQAANECNIKHFYAEIYSAADWHDGPWTYIVLKLLWDPSADVDALLEQWCVAAVGRKAAPVLQKYYENCERFWCNEALQSRWFNRPSMYVFMDFTSRTYLDKLPENFQQEQAELLNEVCVLSNNKKRAALLRQAFDARSQQIESYLEKQRTARMQYRIIRTIDKSVFSDGMGQWSYWQRESSNNDSGGKFQYSKTHGKQAPGSLLTLPEGAKQRPMIFWKNFPAKAGEYYEVTVWCKIENYPRNGEVRLEVKFLQGDEWLDEIYSTLISADISDSNWQQLKCYVKVPAGPQKNIPETLRVHLSTENTDQGAVYWDDFSIKRLMPVK